MVKRFLLALALALGLAAPRADAQLVPNTTLTGTILSPGGTPITGNLFLQLSGSANVTVACGGPAVVASQPPFIFPLANGSVPGGSVVWGANCLVPSGLTYHLTATDSGGQTVVERDVSISGSSVDLGSLSPVVPSPAVVSQLAGDATGPATQTRVVGLQGDPLVTTGRTTGQVLGFNGSAWGPTSTSSFGFLKTDGTTALTANWQAGNFRIDSQNSTRWYNVVAFGADPTTAADSTSAINAAIAAANAAPGNIYFPRGLYKVTAGLTAITGNGVHVIGDTMRNSVIGVTPSAAIVVFTFANGGSIVTDTGIQDIGFTSADTTWQKIGVRVSDASHFYAQRVYFPDTAWTGATSIGFQIRGRQEIRLRDLWVYADQPVSIEPDPNIATIGLDHSSIESSELLVTSGSTNPVVKIADNTPLTNVDFRDVAFVRGGYGLYMSQTTGANAHNTITITNCRWEQNTLATGYAVYLASTTAAIQNLNITGLQCDPAARGIYLRKAVWPVMSSIAYGGTGEFCNFDSSVTGPTILNSFRQSGSTVTDTSTNPTQIGMTVGANPSITTFGTLTATNVQPLSIGSGSQLQFSSTGQMGFNGAPDDAITMNTGGVHWVGGNPAIYAKPASAASTTLTLVATASGSVAYNGNGAAIQVSSNSTADGTILMSTTQSGVGSAERLRITNIGNVYVNEGTASASVAQVGGALFTQTADASVTNTAAETSLIGTGSGSMTLPANLLIAGRTLRLQVRGTATETLGASFTLKVKYGTTVLATTAGFIPGTTTNAYLIDVLITCRSVGGSGTVVLEGFEEANNTGAWFEAPVTSGGAVTIDTTAAKVLDVTVTWSAGSASNTVLTRIATLEVLN